MKICPKCGARLSDGAAFCSDCGAPVAGIEPETPAEAAPAEENAVSSAPDSGRDSAPTSPQQAAAAQTDMQQSAAELQAPAAPTNPQQGADMQQPAADRQTFAASSNPPQGANIPQSGRLGGAYNAGQGSVPAFSAALTPYAAWKDASPWNRYLPIVFTVLRILGGIGMLIALIAYVFVISYFFKDASESIMLPAWLIILLSCTASVFWDALSEAFTVVSMSSWARRGGIDMLPWLRANAPGRGVKMSYWEKRKYRLTLDSAYNASCGRNGGDYIVRLIVYTAFGVFISLTWSFFIASYADVQANAQTGISAMFILTMSLFIFSALSAFLTILVIRLRQHARLKQWGLIHVPENFTK